MAFALHQGTHHPRLQLKHDKTIKHQQQFNSTPLPVGKRSENECKSG